MNYTDFISSNGYICTESEFEIAKAHAKNKLAVIISRFGDANGERLEDYYLEQLIREELRAERHRSNVNSLNGRINVCK